MALAARIDVQAHTVADLDRRLSQIDSAVEAAARRGKTNTALSAIETQKKARASVADERKREASTLAALQVERATVAAKGHQIEIEAAHRSGMWQNCLGATQTASGQSGGLLP